MKSFLECHLKDGRRVAIAADEIRTAVEISDGRCKISFRNLHSQEYTNGECVKYAAFVITRESYDEIRAKLAACDGGGEEDGQ